MKILSILVLFIAGAAAVLLWFIPIPGGPAEPALTLRITNTRARLSERPDIHVYLTNGSDKPLYVTTNPDPFVSGTGMFRNYYLMVSNGNNAIQSTQLFLGMSMPLSEDQLIQARMVALLQPGRSYTTKIPIDKWSDLIPLPGPYWISAGYRGSTGSTALKYPLLNQHLESNPVQIILSE